MKPPTESPPNPQQTAGAASSAPKQKPVIEPPTQPFIIVDGDGPGDPSKFQRFIVPMEFIEKANAVELPRLNPDDFMDTDPPDSAQAAPVGSAQANPEAKKSESPNPAQAVSQETVVVPKRRKSAPIPKELLSGATPTESKPVLKNKLLWVLGGILVFLILLLSHLNVGRIEQAIPSASAALPPVISQLTLPSRNLPSPATSAINHVLSASSAVNPTSSDAQPSPIAERPQVKARPEAPQGVFSSSSRQQMQRAPQPSVTPATSTIPSSTSATTRSPKVFWQQQPE